jgi:VIT1/CCC1 family predicted Fe2+/Mn2+ transporter
MTLTLTLILLAVAFALAGFCGWMGARPRVIGKPRMVPWQFLMMLSAAFGLLMIVHLLNLFGVQTGNRTR